MSGSSQEIFRIAAALLVWATVTSPGVAQTKHTRLVQQGMAGGVNFCLSELDAAVRVIHPDDTAYEALGVWSLSPGNSAWASTSVQMNGGNPTVTNFTVSREIVGGCSIVMHQTFWVSASCGTLRQAAFKDWDYYGSLGGQYTYQGPGTNQSGKEIVVLANTAGGGCMGQKRIAMFGMSGSTKD